MKKAAQEERLRRPKHSKDEMPPPASLQGWCYSVDRKKIVDSTSQILLYESLC